MKTDYYTCLWKVLKESARFLAPKFDNIKSILRIKIYWSIKDLNLRSLHKFINFISTYHWSLGSGKVRCKDIKSLTYWLNALFFHPASINFFVSVSGLGTYIEWLIRLKMSSWNLLYLFLQILALLHEISITVTYLVRFSSCTRCIWISWRRGNTLLMMIWISFPSKNGGNDDIDFFAFEEHQVIKYFWFKNLPINNFGLFSRWWNDVILYWLLLWL